MREKTYTTMKTIIVLASFFALSQAATLLPIDSSVVNVKSERSGQDFSYSIHENRGFAFDPIGDGQHHVPVVKATPHATTINNYNGEENKHLKEHHEIKAIPQPVIKTGPPLHDLTYVSSYPVATYPTYYLQAYTYPYGYMYPHNYNIMAYRTV